LAGWLSGEKGTSAGRGLNQASSNASDGRRLERAGGTGLPDLTAGAARPVPHPAGLIAPDAWPPASRQPAPTPPLGTSARLRKRAKGQILTGANTRLTPQLKKGVKTPNYSGKCPNLRGKAHFD